MKSQVQKGERITITAPADTASGAAVIVNSLFGIAVGAAKTGEDLVLETAGVFEDQPKATGETWAVGEPLYWDNGNTRYTKTAGSLKRVGLALAAAASGDTTGTVRIGYPGAI